MAGIFTSSRVSVTTSATLLWGGDVAAVEVLNLGTASIDIGDSTVTSGAGRPLAAGESVWVEFSDGLIGPGYGIAATGTVSVAVTKIRRASL